MLPLPRRAGNIGPTQQGRLPLSLNKLRAVFQDQICTNLGVHAFPFQICHLHTMPSNCFGLDRRALASALPLPTLLSEAFLVLVRTFQMRPLVICLEHVLRGKRNFSCQLASRQLGISPESEQQANYLMTTTFSRYEHT